jgi:hypothetical protein
LFGDGEEPRVQYRLRVTVNGEVRCLAGFGGPGSLTGTLLIDPALPAAHVSVSGVNEFGASVWLGEELAPGDRVEFELLGPGSADPPYRVHRYASVVGAPEAAEPGAAADRGLIGGS